MNFFPTEYQHWGEKLLDEDRGVYIWGDGIDSDLLSEKDKLCSLVIIGVNERGQKRFLAIEDELGQSLCAVMGGLSDHG